MDNEFSILDDFGMQVLMLDRSTANVLYHLLGGKASHSVVRCQHRCNGWSRDDKYTEIISHEMLAKNQFNISHAMTVRFIDDLSELEDIKEHPLGDLWEYQVPYNGPSVLIKHRGFASYMEPEKKVRHLVVAGATA